ncbi:MAG TPA: hypothetical protein VN829_04235 [Dongiaceae bacterium]|nr:hypothetical protein [Dongiaceae bacterium]
MNTLDNSSTVAAGQPGQAGRPSVSSLEQIVRLLEPLALSLLAHQKPPPELLRTLNRSLVGPFRWAGLEIKRDRLGLLREKLESELCGRFLKWFQNAKAREIAENQTSNAEKIALLRQAVFGEIDELERSGEIVLPD